jgi:hypothetical protein
MKSIVLSGGKVTLVDDEDYEEVSKHVGTDKYEWRVLDKGKGRQYVVRSVYECGKIKLVYLHREIMGAKPGEHVDHIRGGGLDNRRSNLRIATRAQNMWNSRISVANTTGFKGVSYRKDVGKFTARIRTKEKHLFLGYHNTPEEAAHAYDEAARKHHGEFARTNKQLGLLT